MSDVSIKLECPKCRLPIQAVISEEYHNFLLYECPKCHSNVVYYDNKLDIISSKMVKKLMRKRKLQTLGEFKVEVPRPDHGINEDDIIDLKIILETSRDIDEFLSKI